MMKHDDILIHKHSTKYIYHRRTIEALLKYEYTVQSTHKLRQMTFISTQTLWSGSVLAFILT